MEGHRLSKDMCSNHPRWAPSANGLGLGPGMRPPSNCSLSYMVHDGRKFRRFFRAPRNPLLGTFWFLGSCSILVDVNGTSTDFTVMNLLPRKPFWGFLGGPFKAPRNPPEFRFSPWGIGALFHTKGANHNEPARAQRAFCVQLHHLLCMVASDNFRVCLLFRQRKTVIAFVHGCHAHFRFGSSVNVIKKYRILV